MRRIWRLLSKVSVASLLLFLLLLLSALGAFLPQLPPSHTGDINWLSAWLDAASARYGGLGGLLRSLGAFSLYRSPTYMMLVGLAALATLVCTLDRWRRAWRRAFHRPIHQLDPTTVDGINTVTLPIVPLADVQDRLEQRGYRIRVESVSGVTNLRGDRHGLSSAATLISHLAVLLIMAGFGLSTWLGQQTRIEIGPGQSVPLELEPGLAIRNDGFSRTHYPDGSVADYQAFVTLLQEEQQVREATIRLNHPLDLTHLQVTLIGFWEEEAGTGVLLQVGRDPGAVVALIGGLLLLAGMALSLYLPHTYVLVRLDADHALLSVRTTSRVGDGRPEIAALSQELRQ